MYSSPIHLIADKDLSSVNTSSLKSWRKELLLRFKLTTETTLKVNGREYDKATVISIFENLQEESHFHIQLYENKPLLDFIENGKLDFFTDADAQKILEDNAFKTWINDLFAKAYGKVVDAVVKDPRTKNLEKLCLLQNSDVSLAPEAEFLAYSKAFSSFEQFNAEVKEELDRCFTSIDYGFRMLAHVTDYVNPDMKKLIHILPNSFAALKQDYVQILYNQFLFEAFGKDQIDLSVFDRTALRTLLIAAELAKEILGRDQVDNLISHIKRALLDQDYMPEKLPKIERLNKKKKKKESSGSCLGSLLFLFVIFVSLFSFFL